jgi:hypothetical protein
MYFPALPLHIYNYILYSCIHMRSMFVLIVLWRDNMQGTLESFPSHNKHAISVSVLSHILGLVADAQSLASRSH